LRLFPDYTYIPQRIFNKKNIFLYIHHAFKRKLFNFIGLIEREITTPRITSIHDTAAYGGLACGKCCKGRLAYNRRILCEVTGTDDQKTKKNKK